MALSKSPKQAHDNESQCKMKMAHHLGSMSGFDIPFGHQNIRSHPLGTMHVLASSCSHHDHEVSDTAE